jgi:LEA14-like dessication related protein
MESINRQSADRQIQNIQTAISAVESLKVNDFNDFSQKFTDIQDKKTVKQVKPKTARETKAAAVDAKMSEVVRVVSRPDVNKQLGDRGPII